MTVAHNAARYTIQDYLTLEEFANVKHEFFDGCIIAIEQPPAWPTLQRLQLGHARPRHGDGA
jgi:hypothetical protein